jgi:hypothetical protein
MRVVLFVVRFVADQSVAIGSQLSIGLSANAANLVTWLETMVLAQPALVVTLASLLALGSLLVAVAWRSAVTILLVRGTVRRAYKLPYE